MNYRDKNIVNENGELVIPGFDRKYVVLNAIPPRYQWNANSGYCGETSMISAGLYYGQYLSQYDVRILAAGKNDQSQQLLLGVNDDTAATALRLQYERKIIQDSKKFMEWVKQQVAAGYPVIIGVLNNEYRLGESTKPDAGDNEYDHIVPVTGFGSDEPLTGSFNAADKIVLSDNGLYTPENSVPYHYAYRMEHFFSNRVNANNPAGNMYSLLELPEYEAPGEKYNYAIVLKGVMGHEETFPVRITTDLNFEDPSIKDQSNDRPAPMELTLTVIVSGLTPGVNYNLYYYKDENDVPVNKFNQHSKAGSLYQTINITSGTSFMTVLKIKSDEKVFFRAVLAEN